MTQTLYIRLTLARRRSGTRCARRRSLRDLDEDLVQTRWRNRKRHHASLAHESRQERLSVRARLEIEHLLTPVVTHASHHGICQGAHVAFEANVHAIVTTFAL